MLSVTSRERIKGKCRVIERRVRETRLYITSRIIKNLCLSFKFITFISDNRCNKNVESNTCATFNLNDKCFNKENRTSGKFLLYCYI